MFATEQHNVSSSFPHQCISFSQTSHLSSDIFCHCDTDSFQNQSTSEPGQFIYILNYLVLSHIVFPSAHFASSSHSEPANNFQYHQYGNVPYIFFFSILFVSIL